MREHAHMSQSTMSAVGEHMASNVIKVCFFVFPILSQHDSISLLYFIYLLHNNNNKRKTAMDKQWVIVDDVTATANDGQTFELITIEPNGEQQSAEEVIFDSNNNLRFKI